jgi:hypothetical protein
MQPTPSFQPFIFPPLPAHISVRFSQFKSQFAITPPLLFAKEEDIH